MPGCLWAACAQSVEAGDSMEDVKLADLIPELDEDQIVMTPGRTILLCKQEALSAGSNGCIEHNLYGYQEITTVRSVLERALGIDVIVV